jgi:hypothetical protein
VLECCFGDLLLGDRKGQLEVRESRLVPITRIGYANVRRYPVILQFESRNLLTTLCSDLRCVPHVSYAGVRGGGLSDEPGKHLRSSLFTLKWLDLVLELHHHSNGNI